MSSTPVLKKVKMKFKKLHLPAIFSPKTSRQSSPNSFALPETGTAGKPNITSGPEDGQESILSSQPVLLEDKSTVINTKPTPSHPSESSGSPHISADPEPKTSDRFKRGLSVARDALETAFRLLDQSAGAFPPLKAAVGGLVAILDLKEAVTDNDEEYERLATEFTNTAKMLEQYGPALAEGVSGSVARIVESINIESTHIKQRQDRNKIMRTITANQDQGDVIQCYHTIESLFRQLQSDVTLRTWDGVRKLAETALLKDISPVYDALYNSSYSTAINRRGCTAETREKVLEDLKGWVGDSEGAKIYWMNGMAGTGKTTISYTLCEWLKGNSQLGGNYFCSRSSVLCRNVNSIIPTLAHQLAKYSHPFRSALCNVLEEEPEAGKLSVEQQFQTLIQRPLEAVKTAIPDNVVIIIDALDECDDSSPFRLFLDTLLKLAVNLPIKFFITSRPEPAIRGRILASEYSNSILYLHDIEESVVGADIKKYLTEALEFMSPVPSSHDVERLVNNAGKLFIYAATAVRYICPGDPDVDCLTRLRVVLAPVSGSTNQYADLDELYTNILRAALYPPSKRREVEEKNNILLVLKTVVCAKEPMTTQTLASLLSLTEKQVQFSLEPLRSVLHIQENVEKPVVPFHASFPDFLLDKHRSEDEFHCEQSVHNEVLANCCFDLMEKELRFNICNLESSFLPDEDVPNFPERVKSSIPPALLYACRYWGEHFLQGGLTDTVHENLVDFLKNRLLFWMEVLNLKQCLDEGRDIIEQIKDQLEYLYPDTLKQLEDAYEFICDMVDYGKRCMPSTPHLYLFGLAFCPKTSSVHKNYSGHTRGLIKSNNSLIRPYSNSGSNSVAFSLTEIASGSIDETIQEWDAQDGNIVAGPFNGHTDTVWSVAFSPNGTRIVSGSGDETIRVWDAQNGNIAAGPFNGDIGSMWAVEFLSVAFSPDGTQVVSGCNDQTIRVWDAQNGSTVAGPFNGHTDPVLSVAFSPDGTRIVSGSHDQTIRVWDAQNGNTVAGPFNGHKDTVRSVAFSPNGTRIVSGSDDQTIRVWDAQNGSIVAGPFNGHTDAVLSVAFSHDGIRIVSGSGDKTIRVWDAQNGNTVAGPFNGHKHTVWSVAFSPNGTQIVSGSNDHTIRVWDAQNGNIVAGPFNGHTDAVLSVAFSPDGTRIVSGSRDQTIRVWDAQNESIVAGSFNGHTDPVLSVAFSPDGTRIVSGSDDETIRVWHAQYCGGITLSHSCFHGHVHGNLPVKEYRLREDGWITADNNLILWVPRKFHTELLYTGNILAISRRGVVSAMDFSNAFIGEMWAQCYH